jgi:transcriptional regulator
MYTREHFSLPSVAAMREFVVSKSFGVIATHHAGRIFTSPLPLDVRQDESSLFVALHVARPNEMTQALLRGNPATITVLGPDAYVPAEWFGTRSRIPTWVYCAVEISGVIEPSEPRRTREDVEILIDRLQRSAVPGSSWSLAEMRPDLVEGYLQGIVGFRLYDLAFKSCFRLNQRKGGSDSLAAYLQATGLQSGQELARLVLDPPTIRST